ncbi:MAG: Xylose isomerase domain protein barrel [Planctomycetaceae bacterium]|nr:Xylose isomerase domain protein barrel [Planctomycetaceae bacterium]
MTTTNILTRRHFLQQVAASGLVCWNLPRLSAETEIKAVVTFGFTLYGMRKLPLADAFKVCGDIGYDSVELVCMADWPCAPESLSKPARTELTQQLIDNHLSVSSLMENLSPLAEEKIHVLNLERLRRTCELGHDLSPRSTPVIETVLGGKPAEWDQVRKRMADRLQDWAKIAEAGKTIIALKPHVGGALHTPEGAKWLKDQLPSPWLKLAYDFSHFELQAIPMEESLKQMLAETAFVHLKDSQGTASKFQFLLPGDGCTDYREYFRLLKKLGYHGPLVIEVSGQLHSRPDYDAAIAAKRCFANLAPLLAESGLWKPRGKQ